MKNLPKFVIFHWFFNKKFLKISPASGGLSRPEPPTRRAPNKPLALSKKSPSPPDRVNPQNNRALTSFGGFSLTRPTFFVNFNLLCGSHKTGNSLKANVEIFKYLHCFSLKFHFFFEIFCKISYFPPEPLQAFLSWENHGNDTSWWILNTPTNFEFYSSKFKILHNILNDAP